MHTKGVPFDFWLFAVNSIVSNDFLWKSAHSVEK